MAPVASGFNSTANGTHQPPVNPTSARHEQNESIRVTSDNVTYDDDNITSRYNYLNTHVEKVAKSDGTTEFVAKPVSRTYEFQTKRKVPKTG